MDMTAVRSSDEVTRAMSANRAEPTPEPRPTSAFSSRSNSEMPKQNSEKDYNQLMQTKNRH